MGISDQVVSLYASGMSVRDISRHLERSAGIEVSHDTVSRITDGCLEEMRAWQVRPLEQVYPIVFVDALVAKVRDGGSVRNKAVNIAVGVDCEGIKHVLGIWVSAAEGAKAWAQALAQMRNRGLEDVIFCCCDGLGGLGEEIAASCQAATVQTCTVHLIRAASRYGSYADRKALCAAMRPVYTAADMDAAEAALLEFGDSPLGRKYPAAVSVWERAWDPFIPFLEFEPPIRKVIYTTNAIEAFNRQMRKIIKTRGHFPHVMPSSSCCGWVSSTSRTSAPRPGPPSRHAEKPAERARAPDRGVGHPGLAGGTGRVRQAVARPDTGRRGLTGPATEGHVMPYPVTFADQGVFLGPDEADELIDLLIDAAAVTGAVAGHPAAEDARAGAAASPARDCAEFAIDLRLAASLLDADTTAGNVTARTVTARKNTSRAGNRRDTPAKTNTPKKGHDKLKQETGKA